MADRLIYTLITVVKELKTNKNNQKIIKKNKQINKK
jgi:hypothetical protein